MNFYTIQLFNTDENIYLKSFSVNADDNLHALLDSQKQAEIYMEDYFKLSRDMLIDCGMWIDSKTIERDLVYEKNGKELHFVLRIV